MSDPTPPNNWGNLRIRARAAPAAARDPAATRFWIGLSVIVVLALVSPWYGYWVVTWLLGRDSKAALSDMRQQIDADDQRATEASDAQREAERRQDAARQRQEYAQRLAAVRVMGASANAGNPVVIVALGGADLTASTQTICSQSARWLGGSASGKTLQVQAWRGNQPAITVGEIACP